MRLALALCLAAACSSSSKSDEPAATEPAATEPAAPAPEDDARERACRQNGDGATCLTAGEHATKHNRDDLAKELYAMACARGNGAGCAALAKPSRTPSLWHGRACRRGHQPSCAMTDSWAAALRGRAKAGAGMPGWLQAEYERTVEDCAAELPKALREAAGSVALDIDADGVAVASAEPPPIKACLERAAKSLRRPTSGKHAVVISLAAASPAKPE